MVEEIRALGGIASANYDDVSDWAGAENMINQTVEEFGDINVLICNAGILRDRTMLNMSEAEWDLIFQVHCKGSFAPAHFAGNYWKNKSKETGQPQDARIIMTGSQIGLFGNYGQSNYAAAKAANIMFVSRSTAEPCLCSRKAHSLARLTGHDPRGRARPLRCDCQVSAAAPSRRLPEPHGSWRTAPSAPPA